MTHTPLSVGRIADPHYGRGFLGKRRFADSLPKLGAAIETFGARGVDFIVILGDLIDRLPEDAERGEVGDLGS